MKYRNEYLLCYSQPINGGCSGLWEKAMKCANVQGKALNHSTSFIVAISVIIQPRIVI
jgi:hypothetical protein